MVAKGELEEGKAANERNIRVRAFARFHLFATDELLMIWTGDASKG